MIKEIVIPTWLQKKIHKLPLKVREKLYWAIDMLIKNERYPSLRHKKIEGTDIYWEFSITKNYRGAYRQEADKGFLVEVDTHNHIFRHIRRKKW